MARKFARHESHRQRLEYNKKDIGNWMPCKIIDVEASMSVASNVLKKNTIQCQGEVQILSKQRVVQRNTDIMM